MERRVSNILLAACAAIAVGVAGCESEPKSGKDTSMRKTSSSSRDTGYDSSGRQRSGMNDRGDRSSMARSDMSRSDMSRSDSYAAGGTRTTSMAFPTGQRETSAVLVETMLPGQVGVNKEFPYQIRVTNLTDQTLTNVKVHEMRHASELSPADMRMLDGSAGRSAPMRSDSMRRDTTTGRTGNTNSTDAGPAPNEPMTYPKSTEKGDMNKNRDMNRDSRDMNRTKNPDGTPAGRSPSTTDTNRTGTPAGSKTGGMSDTGRTTEMEPRPASSSSPDTRTSPTGSPARGTDNTAGPTASRDPNYTRDGRRIYRSEPENMTDAGPAPDEPMTYPGTAKKTTARSMPAEPSRPMNTPAYDDADTRSMAEPHELGAMIGEETYDVGTLRPRESRTLNATGRAARAGALDFCASVTYTPLLCATTLATAPALELTCSTPDQAFVGQQVAYTLRVTNSGVGPARDVVITTNAPEGMNTADARGTYTIGTLASGQTREVTINATPRARGRMALSATARGAGDLSAQTDCAIVVKQPALTITKTGPETDYTSVGVKFNITVKNTGDAPATNVVLNDPVPAGARFMEANENGRLDGNRTVWNFGTLNPGDTRTVQVRMIGDQPGRFENCATVSGSGIPEQRSCATVTLKGVPGVLLEGRDDPDPIKVGDQTTQFIAVTNQGNAEITNVIVEIELDAKTELVNATGQTQLGNANGEAAKGENGGKTYRFVKIDRLGAKQRAEWQVKIRGTGAGDTRFRIRAMADQIDSPVIKTESTRVYE